MKWLVRVLIVLGVLILVMFMMGSALPQKHTAASSQAFTSTPEAVWVVLTDFESWPSWRSGLKEIQHPDGMAFTEVTTDDDAVEYRIKESDPPRRLVTRIITSDLPYGGSWTYELSPQGEGCLLIITENGEVYNLIFRFLSKYVFGHTTTVDRFLNDLKKKIQ